jgi:thiol-disulfide isomerase/thioredoxin
MKIHAPALALGLALLCNARPPAVMAADSQAPAGGAAAEATSIAPGADALLHKVSDFYAGLKTFRTTLVREPQKGSTGAIPELRYKIEAEKPAKLSIQISGGNERFDGGQAKMDGEKLYLYNPIHGYISSKATGNYDELVRDREFQYATAFALHGQNFLEALLTENPYQFLLQHYGIHSGSLVGQEKIEGESTQHLLLKSHRVAYDIWVDSGSKPWVRRVKVERSKSQAEGKALVFNYERPSSPTEANAADFAFAVPSGAKEITSFFPPSKEAENEAEKVAEKQAEKVAEKQAEQPAQPAEGSGPQALVHKPAPQITLDTIGGGTLDLDSFKSKNVVVLDFWATWCPPCRAALPILAEVTKSYEAKGVKFFAVDLKEDPSKIQKFLSAQGLTVNVALDKDGKAAEKYGVSGIPQSVIIGKDGIVRVVHEGFSEDLKTSLAAELDEILAGKEVSQ